MKKKKLLGAALAAGLVASAANAAIPEVAADVFSMTEVASPSVDITSAGHKCGEGKCGEGKCGEGKCGEGKCGEDHGHDGHGH